MAKNICSNCGAEYDASLTACPFCGYINHEGAEDKFFDDLEGTREKLVELVDAPEAGGAFKDEIRNTSTGVVKRIIAIAIVAVVFIAAGVAIDGILYSDGGHDNKDYAKELAWENEHFPELDKLYEEERFDDMIALLEEFTEADHEVWNWSHYNFADAIIVYNSIEEYLQELDKGKLDKSGCRLLTYDVLYFCYREYAEDIKYDKDLEILDEKAEEVRTIAHMRLGLTDRIIESARPAVYKDGYVDWDEASKIADKYYKNYK